MKTLKSVCVLLILAYLAPESMCELVNFTSVSGLCATQAPLAAAAASSSFRSLRGSASSVAACAVECAASSNCTVFQLPSSASAATWSPDVTCVLASACDLRRNETGWQWVSQGQCRTFVSAMRNASAVCDGTGSTTNFSISSPSARTGSIQQFQPDSTGCYRIVARGGAGGKNTKSDGTTVKVGGRGATASAFFRLSDVRPLSVVVGSRGGNGVNEDQNGAGGGGGSFVYRSDDNALLLAAGGGGGGAKDGNGWDGQEGMNGGSSGNVVGGSGGNGGPAPTSNGNSFGRGGGGGGWLTSGWQFSSGGGNGGGGASMSGGFLGGQGGNSGGGNFGGFGGGGGGGFNSGSGGGGGGYSGGGVDRDDKKPGGGGGSFVNGAISAGATTVTGGAPAASDGGVSIDRIGDLGHPSCNTT